MNDLSHYIREIWMPQMQEKLYKALVGKEICEFIPVSDGNKIHKPYHSDLSTGAYTRNATSSAVSATDVTTTDEYLAPTTARYTSFYIDKLDDVQMFYKSLKGKLMFEAAKRLATDIDSAVLGEYANAGLKVDGGDVGLTAGQPIALSLTAGNGFVLDVFEAAKAKLATNNVINNGDWFMVIDAHNYFRFVERYLLAAGFKIQDNALVNGYVGNISGINIYVSNNLPTSTVSGMNCTHWLAGEKGAVTLATVLDASLDVIENPMNTDGTHRLGTQYVISSLYGQKTFYWNAKKLVDIQINY